MEQGKYTLLSTRNERGGSLHRVFKGEVSDGREFIFYKASDVTPEIVDAMWEHSRQLKEDSNLNYLEKTMVA